MELKEIIELYEFFNRREKNVEEIIEAESFGLIEEIKEMETEIRQIKEILSNMSPSLKCYDDLPFKEGEDIPLF